MIDKLNKRFRKFVRRRKLTNGQNDVVIESWRQICPRLFGPVEYEARKLLYVQLCEMLALDRQDSSTEDFVYYTVHSDDKLMLSGKETLKRVMTAVKNTSYYNEQLNEEVISAIASILLNAMSEDEVFATVTMLIQSELHNSCLISNLVPELLLFQLQRDKILKKFFTEHSKIITPAQLLQDWSEWLFLDLPPSHVTCLIDCYLNDGIKCLFSILNVILQMWYRSSRCIFVKLDNNDSTELKQDIASFFVRLNIQPADLLKSAFANKRKKSKEESNFLIQNVDAKRKDSSKSGNSTLSSEFDESSPESSCFLNASEILSENEMADLYLRVPIRYQLHEVKRLFSSLNHGISIKTLWNYIEHSAPTLIIIQTTKNEIFGAFCTQAWHDRRRHKKLKCFGTGESFVFKFSSGSFFLYKWVGLEPTSCKLGQDLFQAADEETMIIGGGAISIRYCLQQGNTGASSTYLNPPLSTELDFDILNLEVFGFC